MLLLCRFLIQFCIFVLGALLIFAPAIAQIIPNHADPSARAQLPDSSAVPAIRFLTTTDFPPFNFRDPTGDLVGFNVDLARAICDELAVVCTIQPWPWEQAEDALVSNQGDALIGGVALDFESAKNLDFSSVYLTFPARFVVHKANLGSFDPDMPQGAVIAVRAGSRHAVFAQRFLPGTELLESETELEALDAVLKGKAVVYFGDAMRAAFWLNINHECCDFLGDAYFRPDYFGEGLAIAVPAGRDAIRVAIDAALSRLQKKGKFDELYLRWFPISFY